MITRLNKIYSYVAYMIFGKEPSFLIYFSEILFLLEAKVTISIPF